MLRPTLKTEYYWYSERSSNLPRVTHLIHGKVRIPFVSSIWVPTIILTGMEFRELPQEEGVHWGGGAAWQFQGRHRVRVHVYTIHSYITSLSSGPCWWFLFSCGEGLVYRRKRNRTHYLPNKDQMSKANWNHMWVVLKQLGGQRVPIYCHDQLTRKTTCSSWERLVST